MSEKIRFNPYSVDHMKAFDYLCKTGTWPDGFNVDTTNPTWIFDVYAVIAQAYLELVKHNKIFGMPPYED